jgi:hypothetical protein
LSYPLSRKANHAFIYGVVISVETVELLAAI